MTKEPHNEETMSSEVDEHVFNIPKEIIKTEANKLTEQTSNSTEVEVAFVEKKVAIPGFEDTPEPRATDFWKIVSGKNEEELAKERQEELDWLAQIKEEERIAKLLEEVAKNEAPDPAPTDTKDESPGDDDDDDEDEDEMEEDEAVVETAENNDVVKAKEKTPASDNVNLSDVLPFGLEILEGSNEPKQVIDPDVGETVDNDREEGSKEQAPEPDVTAVVEEAVMVDVDEDEDKGEDVDELERLAIQELLLDAKRGAERAREFGPLGWQRARLPPTNKRFLVNTIRNSMRDSDGRYSRRRRRSRSPERKSNGNHRRRYRESRSHSRERSRSRSRDRKRRSKSFDTRDRRDFKRPSQELKSKEISEPRKRAPVIRNTTKSTWSSDEEDLIVNDGVNFVTVKVKTKPKVKVNNKILQVNENTSEMIGEVTKDIESKKNEIKTSETSKRKSDNNGAPNNDVELSKKSKSNTLQNGISERLATSVEKSSPKSQELSDKEKSELLKRKLLESSKTNQNLELAKVSNDVTRAAQLDIVEMALREIHDNSEESSTDNKELVTDTTEAGIEASEAIPKLESTAPNQSDPNPSHRKKHKKHKKHKHKHKSKHKRQRSGERR